MGQIIRMQSTVTLRGHTFRKGRVIGAVIAGERWYLGAEFANDGYAMGEHLVSRGHAKIEPGELGYPIAFVVDELEAAAAAGL